MEYHRRHSIPVYNVTLEVVVTDSIQRSHDLPHRCRRLGGTRLEIEDPSGLTTAYGSELALFLELEDLNHGTISHELYHTAMAILERAGELPNHQHQEPCAYLIGYLANLVYSDLGSWGVLVGP